MISNYWNGGRGAVTVLKATEFVGKTINTTNSLTGKNDGDNVGNYGIHNLDNGYYAVQSSRRDDGTGTVTILRHSEFAGTQNSKTNSLLVKGKKHSSPVMTIPSGRKIVVAGSTLDQRVIIGLLDPNQLTFSLATGQTVTMTSDFIERTLSRGQNVVLQASNDITINSDIVAQNNGNGGDLLLQAGRSILVNANIITDSGNLNLYANELLSAGVIDEDRDQGAATIRLASGVNLDTGTGNIVLQILAGTDKKYKSAGNIDLVGDNALTAKSIQLLNLGDELNNGIVLGAGTLLKASGSDTALTLISDIFTNNAGANVFDLSGTGRFLVYSKNWTADTRGSISAKNLYNKAYVDNLPASITTGNHFIYADQPLLTVTANDVSRIYGENNPVFTYTLTGLVNGDMQATYVAGSPALSSLATATTNAGTAEISLTQGSLASAQGYGFSFLDGTLTIAQRALTWTATAKSKTYNGDTIANVSFTTGNVVNNDVLTLTGTSTYNDKNTGTKLNISISKLVLGGSKAANYTYEKSGKTTGEIMQRDLTVTVTANNKIYDGKTDATSLSFSDDALDADTLTFGSASALFDSKNAGQRIVTVSGITILSGDAHNNYKLTSASASDQAEITQRDLTVTVTANNKTYDGGRDATLTFSDDTLDTDTLTFESTSALFDSKNAGKWNVTVDGITIKSGDATKNYKLLNTKAFDQAEITKASLIIAAQNETKTADSVPYSGGPGIVLAGLAAGESIDDLNGSLTWLGTSQGAVKFGTYSLIAGGLTSSNYSVSYVDGTLDIRPAPTSSTSETTRPEYFSLNLGGLFAELSRSQNLENFETADIGDGSSIPLLICDGQALECRNIEVSSLLQ